MVAPSNPEQDIQPKASSSLKRILSLVVKLLLTAACFWYISSKIDFSQALHALQRANWLLLFASTLLYVLSKVISAYRLNIYFKNIGVSISQQQNLKLYWLGMFYNLFLPGAISGDAYKVILLRKYFDVPYRHLTAAVFLDRFSGLLGLGIILCGFGIFIFEPTWLKLMFAVAPIVAIAVFYTLIFYFFKAFRRSFFPTLLFGILVQATQVVGVFLILSAVGIFSKAVQWLFIFLAAQIITVLPISLGGGLGTREVLFAEGANYFQLDASLGVAISLLFYLTSVAASTWGVKYVFRSPLKGLKPRKSPLRTFNITSK